MYSKEIKSKQHSSTASLNKDSVFFQPKLSVNQPNDVYEQEANAMADKVTSTNSQSTGHEFFKPAESALQRKENNAGAVNGNAEAAVNKIAGKGEALNSEVRSFFEPKFGYDFSNVKIHRSAEAAESAQSIDAQAYTAGNNIVFNEGRYSPGSNEGQKLLAHELTHVVQQNNGAGSSQVQRAPNPPGWDELHKYKYPGGSTIRLTHFTTKNLAGDPFSEYVTKAKELLKEHNLSLDVYEAGEVDYARPLQDMDDVEALRMAGHKKFQDKQNDDKARLPVFSASYSTVKGFDASELNGQVIKGTNWLPFVILNAANKSTDKVTLLHEVGHAADVPGDKDIPVKATDAVQNFMLYGDNRTDMLRNQVIALAKAYFSG